MDVGNLEVCLGCPYYENKTCGKCIFAKWNIQKFESRGAEIIKKYRSQLAVKSFNNIAKGIPVVVGNR